MTYTQICNKMERVNKQMYKEISKGNFDKADQLRKQYVDLNVKALAMIVK